VGVAELSAGRVAWARNAEAMSRLGNDSDFSISNHWYSPTLKSLFIHRLPGLSSVMFGDVRRCSAMLWRCSAMLWRCSAMLTPSWTTPHHKSPLDEINEIRRNAADSLWVLKVTRRRILPLTAII